MVKSLIVKLDGSLHKEFKKCAADNEETMANIITGCINRYISDKKKKLIH